MLQDQLDVLLRLLLRFLPLDRPALVVDIPKAKGNKIHEAKFLISLGSFRLSSSRPQLVNLPLSFDVRIGKPNNIFKVIIGKTAGRSSFK